MKNQLPLLTLAVAITLANAAQAQVTGPSSSATPYVIPSNPLTTTVTSILTVGDSVNLKPDGINPYRMVGIPDGMGAYDNALDGDPLTAADTFTVLLNHELGNTVGVSRAHGSVGSFVSKWVIRKSDFTVLSGSDLIQTVATWNTTTSSYNAPATGVALGRLCSGDLAPVSAYFNSATGLGTQARIFQSGEEVGAEGRQFAHIATGAAAGTSYELPRLGKFSWENGVANGGTGDKTVVLGTDDSTPGQVYLYIGTKTNTGNDVERAGLTNGGLWGIKAPLASEDRTNGFDGVAGNEDSVPFTLHSFGNVENTTGLALQTASTANGVTEFLRPEDVAWSLTDATKAYFVTTDRFDTGATVGASRLWELDFSDVNDFTLGGTLKMLIEGSGAADGQMFDNIAVTLDGKIIIQEDPGNNAYLAKTWSYDIAGDTLTELLVSDAARFSAPTAPFSRDEESSGVIDISEIVGAAPGTSVLLGNMQAHYSLGGELVEGGQLYVTTVVPEPTTAVSLLGGVGMILGLRRRRA